MPLLRARRFANRKYPLAESARISVLALAGVIAVGTLILMLPISRTGAPPWPNGDAVLWGPSLPGGAPLTAAFFTATSASCVTGLIVVDTQTYWSAFGQVVLTVLMEIGGLGTMTFAALMGILLADRLNLRQRLLVASATGMVSGREIGHVVKRIVVFSLGCQAVMALPMIADLRFRGEPWTRAIGHGAFLAISAYNNAGFSVYTDSLISFASDPFILLPISTLIIVGGLGFPVLVEFMRALRGSFPANRRFSLNTRTVIFGTVTLLGSGWLLIALLEWNNPHTISDMSVGGKLLVTFFSSVSPRTAGFNAMDIAGQSPVTWLVTDVLMFIGGGPAGTAGGMKVTTALVLVFLVATEIRAGRAVQLFGARMPRSVHRQAITVLVLAFVLVLVCTGVIMEISHVSLDRTLYEVISALGTVGLSTGITPTLPISAQLTLCLLMFFGRVGPVTIATALAVTPDNTRFELPKERLLIG